MGETTVAQAVKPKKKSGCLKKALLVWLAIGTVYFISHSIRYATDDGYAQQYDEEQTQLAAERKAREERKAEQKRLADAEAKRVADEKKREEERRNPPGSKEANKVREKVLKEKELSTKQAETLRERLRNAIFSHKDKVDEDLVAYYYKEDNSDDLLVIFDSSISSDTIKNIAIKRTQYSDYVLTEKSVGSNEYRWTIQNDDVVSDSHGMDLLAVKPQKNVPLKDEYSNKKFNQNHPIIVARRAVYRAWSIVSSRFMERMRKEGEALLPSVLAEYRACQEGGGKSSNGWELISQKSEAKGRLKIIVLKTPVNTYRTLFFADDQPLCTVSEMQEYPEWQVEGNLWDNMPDFFSLTLKINDKIICTIMNKKGSKNTRELSEYNLFSQYAQELDEERKKEKERLLTQRIPKRDMNPKLQKELNSVLPSGHYLRSYGSGNYFDDGQQTINPNLSILYFTTEFNERASLFVITKPGGSKTYADIELGLGSDPRWQVVEDMTDNNWLSVILDSGDERIQVTYVYNHPEPAKINNYRLK